MVKISLEFSGGLEILFGNVKKHEVDVPATDGVVTVGALMAWTRGNLIKQRPELFMKGETVRPGVLVLVNDCDWELLGMLECELHDGDTVIFISTLHGG